jgi:hypothetical protein
MREGSAVSSRYEEGSVSIVVVVVLLQCAVLTRSYQVHKAFRLLLASKMAKEDIEGRASSHDSRT